MLIFSPPFIQIVRLIYANSGGILALTHSGEHKLWKWQKNEQNVMGKVWLIFKATSSLNCFSFELFLYISV